jgi:hypothetical protein
VYVEELLAPWTNMDGVLVLVAKAHTLGAANVIPDPPNGDVPLLFRYIRSTEDESHHPKL